MLQAELTNSASSAPTNVIAHNGKQADIVKKIEELNKWQEEQKKLLQIRQIMQRKMLGMEHKTMYQMLGLNGESEMALASQDDKGFLLSDEPEHLDEYVDENMLNSLDTSQLDEEAETDEEGIKDKLPVPCISLKTPNYNVESYEELPQMQPKKTFLKRGEGLKQRFKIDPNDLRLNNLPKYKYANAHPKLRMKPSNKFSSTKDIQTIPTNSVMNAKKSETVKSLDAQEQRFQNLLITSQNTCSSTPDTKSSFATNKLSDKSKKYIPGNEKLCFKKGTPVLTKKLCEVQSIDTTNTQQQAIAWSKILDPLEIQPLEVPRNCKTSTLPQTEESIFELLEQKANEGSFDMDSTCLKEFMSRKITNELDGTDIIPVHDQLKTKRLEPVVSSEKIQEASCSSAGEEEDDNSQLTDSVERTESDNTTHKTVETTNSSYPQYASEIKVRFSDSNETHEYDDEPESTLYDTRRLLGGTENQDDQGDTSNNELFTQFKQALFAALQIKADEHLANDSTLNNVSNTTLAPKHSTSDSKNCNIDSTIYSPACIELQEKTDMIKIRLAELEKEIQVFKENNVVLMKAKQEHELQKSLNAQEHLEAMESLKDEKIRMEIYLHDERLKMEDEKRQFEINTKMKTQGIIAKERKERDHLREQVAQLEMQLKSKESNHTAAQARLRTQIRNLEREQNKLHEQIENLTRENKRLENENLKISREQNNKILLEINRNIAKLAPKQIQHCTNTIPDEGPPVLGTSKPISKSKVSGATANKNINKVHKTTSTNFSNSKLFPNNKVQPIYKEAETTPETSFIEEKQYQHKQQSSLKEHVEEDTLKEFQTSPLKGTNITTTAKASGNKESPQSLPHESQNQVPAPPPSSPRSSGGYSGNMSMKREIVNDDGSKDIWYPNGNLKKISADGMIIRMLYYNKDIKETSINEGTVKYYYAETNTWHTTYLDGLEILEFPNGQVEHRHKNGVVEVHYPNNSIKIMDPKDEHKQEEWRFPDGTHLVQMRNGDKILSLPNGQKEIHNKLHKRREYPDGTVKIVYPDGSTETRYSNGRVRLKDKQGKLVMDTDLAK